MIQEQVFIALGGNLGDVFANFVRAMGYLDNEPQVSIKATSYAYQTRPWGGVEQPDFVNAVAWLKTDLSALEMLAFLQALELKLGRTRTGIVNGPRHIDLDLLCYGQMVCASDHLTLPHPRLAERSFVLFPWMDVAPDFKIPGLTTVKVLYERLATSDKPLRLPQMGELSQKGSFPFGVEA